MDNSLDTNLLSARYHSLLALNSKTHLCSFYFRQRCLRSPEACPYAHGLSELRMLPTVELLALRQELFNLKQKLGRYHFAVMKNLKKGKYEVYKRGDIEKLKSK